MNRDMIWNNVRLGLVGAGVAALMKWFPNIFTTNESAASVIEPIVIGLGGGLVALASIIWANVVGRKAVAVPEEVAKRADVETVSPVTGKVEPPNIYR